jgi:hypothetical protein
VGGLWRRHALGAGHVEDDLRIIFSWLWKEKWKNTIVLVEPSVSRLDYGTTSKVEWRDPSELPPTQRSKVAGSSVQSFFAVLQ